MKTPEKIGSAEAPDEKGLWERFGRKISSKLMTMALAGFLTFGPGTTRESYANQLKISQRENSAPQFVVENGLTEEKLKAFEERLKREEPEFIIWLGSFENKVNKELDELSDDILIANPAKDKEEELQVFKVRPKEYADKHIDLDHAILDAIRKDSDQFRRYIAMLRDNMRSLILGPLMVHDSRAVREDLIQHLDFPSVVFENHSISPSSAYARELDIELINATNEQVPLPDKWQPAMFFNPRSFSGKTDTEMNAFVDAFIHELNHTLQPGSFVSRAAIEGRRTHLMQIFREGSAQETTLASVQMLHQKYPKMELKPYVGYSEYDGRVVIASIVSAILENHKPDDSIFSKWYHGLISYDDFKVELRQALEKLNVNSDKIVAYFDKIEKDPVPDYGTLVKNFIVFMVVELKLGEVNFNSKLIENVLKEDRNVDPWQVENIRSTTMGGVKKAIDQGIKKLKKTASIK
ncbi:MAG: hypothetical protein A3B99_04770 [Candidatus Yanofskybacteria bacterium RIFCSPHIGHO2_02_FULL_44_12b]|uniref:Uncharacterized protein n=2 Tax=Candidatus Yanofskyibacteriota TaxID=1752733 RepID=A0A1F8GL83_9BACT|nr:MAG: hypothetical protein UW79_C0003G0022 [Candidatus Yanofskybacteria bacterium GW2011_GWA2_44_9]OGN04380.1 MAG: hypothetical protein A2659_03570 [Candidatus Yanofskybacteria bacterium RIFCSPHIGHO2_01_FULL_44_24]OGN14489.1 MAG: hypothetical protein A3B99_04770 [Candidatus Yanofskybacteria bacterium RIFCSPHIGHO2_02_FULL_44_12b]OGN25770.1 MAG: hypothetical protein A2925_01110 [Candidatus Yanofskybacteria bacterium RIFCSPLOWO2_01_FULL_44_22]